MAVKRFLIHQVHTFNRFIRPIAWLTPVPTTIFRLIDEQAYRKPDAVAIADVGRIFLTYSRLRDHIEYTVSALNAMGIGRDDRIALVLPNGPELTVALVAVASGATAAPLNAALVTEEFSFFRTSNSRLCWFKPELTRRRWRQREHSRYRYSAGNR